MTRALGRALWLVPPTFALHAVEEAPGFTRWLNRNISDEYSQADFVRNNLAGMAMTLAGTWMLAKRPGRSLVFLYFVAVVSQQGVNGAWHAGTTAAYGEYSPGLVTGLLLLPLHWRLTRMAGAAGLLGPRSARAALLMAGAVHAQVLARQVYKGRGPQDEPS